MMTPRELIETLQGWDQDRPIECSLQKPIAGIPAPEKAPPGMADPGLVIVFFQGTNSVRIN